MAIKVFKGGPEFKSLKREIDVVRSLPHQENIVALYTVEEEVSSVTWLSPFSTYLLGCGYHTGTQDRLLALLIVGSSYAYTMVVVSVSHE